jgi:type II secretory pathway pseudopilin PulG
MASDRRSEKGMTLLAVMGGMAIFAVALLAVAPSVYIDVQRERELESIRRGEEIAEAIRLYVEYYRGSRLPQNMDDLLEGLPQGTKKRQILRASAATDPLSEDGKWRLIKADPETLARFARRVQNFNNGLLPPNPSRTFDRYTIIIVNSINTDTDESNEDEDFGEDDDFEVLTENTPFIGVASQSKSRSVIAYYGIGRHSSWIFTPLFRGPGSGAPTFQQVPGRGPRIGGGREPGGRPPTPREP